jgi:hypothetical protein
MSEEPIKGPQFEPEPEHFNLELLRKLTRDMKEAAATMRPREARYANDAFYAWQKNRMRMENQLRKLKEFGEPHEAIEWGAESMWKLEQQQGSILDYYSAGQYMGRWARSHLGVGPVLASGLLAYINFEKRPDGVLHPPTVGHIWRFGGVDPSVVWLGKEKSEEMVKAVVGSAKVVTTDHLLEIAKRTNRKVERIRLGATVKADEVDAEGEIRKADVGKITKASLVKFMSRPPWCQKFKLLLWKLGVSFSKVSGNPAAKYGLLYADRKQREEERNAAGMFKDEAARTLQVKKIGKSTDTYKAYAAGLLPKGRIMLRAMRYAVKLFLSHYHEVAYRHYFNAEPPKPFAIAHGGHYDYIPAEWGPKASPGDAANHSDAGLPDLPATSPEELDSDHEDPDDDLDPEAPGEVTE